MKRLDRLEDIREENYIWLVYIGIIVLNWYANTKEEKYFLYNDQKCRQEYQDLLVIIFTIVLIVYLYFVKGSFDDILGLNPGDSEKKVILTYASFIASILILISGIIYLIIAVSDEDIETEIAF